MCTNGFLQIIYPQMWYIQSGAYRTIPCMYCKTNVYFRNKDTAFTIKFFEICIYYTNKIKYLKFQSLVLYCYLGSTEKICYLLSFYLMSFNCENISTHILWIILYLSDECIRVVMILVLAVNCYFSRIEIGFFIKNVSAWKLCKICKSKVKKFSFWLDYICEGI